MLGNKLNQSMSVKQTLSTSQVQSLNILSMTNYELQEFLENEYQENPLLEFSGSSIMKNSDNNMNHFADSENQETLLNDLLNQIPPNKFNDFEIKILNTILDFIDSETGFLIISEEELKIRVGSANAIVFDQCLEFIRELDPIGIGFSTLEESLLHQAEKKGILDEKLKIIISEYLEEIAKGHLGKISTRLSISSNEVRKYIMDIKELNPRPACTYERFNPQFIIPDVIISLEDGEWEIELNDNWIGTIEINSYYEKMANQSHDEEISNYFNEKLNRVKMIIKSIEQRRNTLIKVTECIIKQQLCFITQKKSLKPLILRDIAEELDVHVSTISRTIKNKYLQTPAGTYSYKCFFSEAVSNSFNGTENACSVKYIKEMISKIINEESGSKPYSDNKITNMLNEKNIEISRRTVAKYREELNIPCTINRKKI